MLPEWMKNTDHYVPPKDGGTFAIKTIQTIGKIMSRLKTQAGHEKQKHLPALVKLFTMVLLIILTSVCQHRIILMGIAAAVLGYLCTWPAKGLWGILKTPMAASALTLVLFIPAMLMHPAGIPNNLIVVAKVFLCVTSHYPCTPKNTCPGDFCFYLGHYSEIYRTAWKSHAGPADFDAAACGWQA